MDRPYIKIKASIPKLSDAIKAMVAGLREAERRENFEVRFGSYGYSERKDMGDDCEVLMRDICYGCAATCAVQKAMGDEYPAGVIADREDRAWFFDIDPSELHLFEMAIDTFRCGNLAGLLGFYGEEVGDDPKVRSKVAEIILNHSHPTLNDIEWKTRLLAYDSMIERLVEAGY